MLRRTLVVALLLVASVAAAQHSQRDVSLRHGYPEYLALQSRVALTGACTWTVASGSVTLAEVGDCAALTTEVSAGDVLLIPGDSNTSTTCGGPQNVDSYTVLSVNDTDVGGADGDIDSFTLCRGHDVGATGVTVYLIGQGLGASLTTVGGWDGTASALDLSTGGARVRGDVAAGVNGAGGAAGSLTLNNGLNPGSSTTITQPELAMLDGITAGAGAAGKALVLDSSADVASGLRNVTASGTVGAGTLTEGGIGVPNLDELDASSELAAIIDDETGTGVAVFGTGPTLTLAQVTAAATGDLTAANVSSTVVTNYGQLAANTQTLPTAAAGMNAIFVIGTAGAGAFNVKAGASDCIYLNSVKLDDADKAALAAPAVGNYLTCWTFQTGAAAWDWICSIGSGTWTDGGA